MRRVEETPKATQRKHLSSFPIKWKTILAALLIGLVVSAGANIIQYQALNRISNENTQLKKVIELEKKSRSIQYGAVKIKTLDVYWNDQFTSRVETVGWGSLQREESRNVTIYIRNQGDENITGLAQVTSNWNPPVLAEGYINLSWDYAGHTLEPSHVESVTLNLTVNENTPVGVGTFSFDIIIFSIDRSSNAATIVSYGTLQGD